MGEITKETRTYTLPFLDRPIAITTQFRYDSWGRIDTIIYPDNEQVYYHYDHGGQLREITSYDDIFGYFSYLQNVTYDKFGAKISQQYGNGITTSYVYDEYSRRLMEIATSNGSQIYYNYDPVGNVTGVYSNYSWRGTFGESFHYDEADQLVEAYGNDYYNFNLKSSNFIDEYLSIKTLTIC